MPEILLRQPGFTHSACGLFTKNKKRIQKFKERRDLWYFYQNEPDQSCFQHDTAYGCFKDLPRRTASDKIFPDKNLMLLKIGNMMDIKEVLLQWFTNFSIKSLLVVVLKVKLYRTNNHE